MSKLAHSHQPTMDKIDARRALQDDLDEEATAFAMELLMPAEWIRRDAARIDVDDQKAIKKLAQKYQVSPSVMALRIGQLAA